MSWLWLLAGVGLLAAGSRMMTKGMTLAVGKGSRASLISGFLILAGGKAGPVIILAAAASLLEQPGVLMFLLLGAGVFGAAAVGGLLGVIRPFPNYRAVLKREYPALMLALLYLVIAGRGTFAAGHPDAVLGRFSGILFLVLFAGECVLLLSDSMKGYVLPKYKAGWPAIPALLLAGIGLCIAVIGGIMAVDRMAGVCDRLQAHPALFGMAVGIAAVFFFFAPSAFAQSRAGGRGVMPGLWGPSSLALTGGLGIACVIRPVTMSYGAVQGAIFAMALILLNGLLTLLSGRKTGRISAACLLAGVIFAVGILCTRIVNGIY